jgi:SCY1-like protein 2
VLPMLWTFSLGPLLNLQQFQAFMSLIKTLSGRIEREQTRKLQEMGSSSGGNAMGTRAAAARSGAAPSSNGGFSNGEETDFETLVSGRKSAANGNGDLMNEWAAPQPARSNNTTAPPRTTGATPSFSWQTPDPAPNSSMGALRPVMQNQASRTVTPDHTLSSFATLTPASQWSQPLQPTAPSAMPYRPAQNPTTIASKPASTIDWSSAVNNNSSSSAWSSQKPAQPSSGLGSFNIPPPPMSPQSGFGGMASQQQKQTQQASGQQKTGLDKYQSLI